jgi:hypothetical protein
LKKRILFFCTINKSGTFVYPACFIAGITDSNVRKRRCRHLKSTEKGFKQQKSFNS